MVKIIFLGIFICTYLIADAKEDGTISEKVVNGSKVMVCSMDKVKKNEITIPLSQLVEDCSLIHLENLENAFFKPWFTTVTDKYIGVRQQGGNPYKLFSRSGNFLCDIGSIGHGPGEFTISLYDDLIDEKNELIYLAPMTGDKILVFSTSGKFIKNIIAPIRLKKPKLYLSDGILTVIHMAFRGDEAIVFQFDSNGDVIKKLSPPAHLLVNDYNGEIFNTRNTREFEFLHTSSDTLYHYDIKRNRILPVFTIQSNASEKPFRQYMELNNQYISNVFGKGLIYNDKTNRTSSYIKIVNDYYGNLSTPGSVVNFRNGWYVYNLQPEQLMENIEKRLVESSCTGKDKQKLEKLLSSLEEGANNVLFLGKLK
ncbi:MAG: 6-bladed beta-propeller [Bacteroidales bacterium]|jgi:hypothetical protein|nr:6-bladed beta-propeller [Bacteroidales bacterium]